MKRIRSMVLALVAVFALSVAASAASAHEFNAKPTGGIFPAATAGTGGTQTFKSGFGTITCTAALATGRALKGSELATEQTVIYEGCTDNLGGAVDPIKALYEISADEKVSILAPIVINLLGAFAKCTITVEKQNNLGGIKFKNNAAKTELTVESKTPGIVQLGSGGFCTNGTGEYTGNVTGHLVAGGELFWT
jgi:hypothetical protein